MIGGGILGGAPMPGMKRREFVALLGGAAAAWPLAVHAQQGERVRRIGVLMNVATDIQDFNERLAAFQQALQELGWTLGRNVRIDTRWAADDAERLRSHAAELVALAPDAVLAQGSLSVAALHRVSRTVPIVFVGIVDPVGSGFVDSLARPRGNVTRFAQFEYNLSSKWLELLKEIAPRVTRVAVIRNPANPSGIGQFAAIQTVAPSLGVELRPVDVRGAGEIERAVATFARSPNDGLIVTTAGATAHRDLIIALAARHRLPRRVPLAPPRRRRRPDLLWA
jgi:ABC-type uncharacterized transport system substrate-binding protein